MKFGTRMDASWQFRSAYEKARQIKDSQDAFCAKVEAGVWDDPQVKGRNFPNDLQLEALVDVLRGRVKVHCHTYEAVDIDFLQRVSSFQISGSRYACLSFPADNRVSISHGRDSPRPRSLSYSRNFEIDASISTMDLNIKLILVDRWGGSPAVVMFALIAR